MRGDQVFGERVCATTDGITSTDHYFPDEDFFPDLSSLYIDAMADDTGVNANLNPNLNANPIPPPAPYVICSYLVQFLLQFLLQFLVLALGIDVICLFWLNMICSFVLLVYMIRLILALIVMIYYYLFRIKYYGNLLIFSTTS